MSRDIRIISNKNIENENIEIKKLYKYIPLSINIVEENNHIDNKRIRTLLNNQIWFSNYKTLNDPFETLGNALYREKHQGKGAAQVFNNTINKMSVVSTSFCEEWDNLPLWGNYANAHKGFCLEYEIESKENIFKVEYKEDRSNEYMLSMVSIRSDDDETKWGHQLSIKAKSWEYEKEYRIIAYDKNGDIDGVNIDTKQLGIKLSKIIIGLNCSKENKKVLKMCAKELSVDVEKVSLPDNSFKLRKKKIKPIDYRKYLSDTSK